MRILLSIAALAVLSGCSSYRSISYDEAATFERSMLARAPIAHDNPAPNYTQPVNKKEDCKLSTSQDQLERKNFSAYWDGECKNGFAFGLGRNIAISDTHHYDKITIYDENRGDSLQPIAFYNYVENVIMYAVIGPKYPAKATLMQRMLNTVSGFEMQQKLLITDESGNEFEARADPFRTERIFINTPMGQFISYVVDDNTAMPVTNPNAVNLRAGTLDPRNNHTPGGVAVFKYGDGNVRHFKGGTKE